MTHGIRHIRAFLAVARLGSFTRAAGLLNVSQPALTVQIHQLEESLGTSLFDRNKRQVLLTQAGRDLQPPFARLLADFESVIDAGHDIAGLRRGSVAVAALPSVAAGMLCDVVRRYRAELPRISVRINDGIGDRILQLVKEDAVDFGIGSRLGPDRDIEVEDLFTDRLAVFCPSDHPLARRRTISLRDVAACPLILTIPGTSVRALVERALEKEGLEFTLTCETIYMSTSVALVRAGLGVAILPESAVATTDCRDVLARPIQTPGLTRKVVIIRKRNRSLSPAAQRFAEMLRDASKVSARTQALSSPRRRKAG